MEYRRLGNSGLKVSTICLGAMMFGERTTRPSPARIVALGARRRRQLHRHRRHLRQGRVRAHVGQADRQAARPLGARDQGRRTPCGGATRIAGGRRAQVDARTRSTRAWSGSRPITSTSITCTATTSADAARGDGRDDRRSHPRRQGALLRASAISTAGASPSSSTRAAGWACAADRARSRTTTR